MEAKFITVNLIDVSHPGEALININHIAKIEKSYRGANIFLSNGSLVVSDIDYDWLKKRLNIIQ